MERRIRPEENLLRKILNLSKKIQNESRQKRKSQKEVVQYVERMVEPIIKDYIAKLLFQITYMRRIDLKFRWDRDWEINMLKNVSIGLDNPGDETHHAFDSGRGSWNILLDGISLDYELLGEWDTNHIAVSLTLPKMKRVMLGEFVPNVPGHVFIILPPPKKRKIDNSILDKKGKSIDEYIIGEKSYVVDITSNLDTSSNVETELPIEKVNEEALSDEYKNIELEMKKAIQSLGWKWKEIDKNKMDRCIRETLEEDGKFEVCLIKFLKKEKNDV